MWRERTTYVTILFYVEISPSCAACCFSAPPSVIFPASSVLPLLFLTCPFPTSRHLYLIPSSVCLLIVFVLPPVFVCLFRVLSWCHPVFPTSVDFSVSPWYVSVFFLFLEFSFVLHFLEASFHYYFVVCPWDTFLFFFPGFVPFSFC